jgi:hypothetical protein
MQEDCYFGRWGELEDRRPVLGLGCKETFRSTLCAHLGGPPVACARYLGTDSCRTAGTVKIKNVKVLS